MIRVFIADDHAVVRRGIKDILEDAPDIVLEGEAASGREALTWLRSHRADVILLDIALPDISGMEVLRQLTEGNHPARVIVLSMYPEEQYARRAVQAGAWGYLTKDSAPEELVTAIREVAEGRRYITPSVAEQLIAALTSEDVAPHERLSNREMEVLRLLASGKTVSQVAEALYLSPKTVSTYRQRILAKLGLKTTAELIRYAIEHDLV